MQKLSFIFIILFVGFTAFAQNGGKFQRITVKDGLSQGNINAILADSKGFLWFGTQDGLNRYDGYTFKIFKPNRDDKSAIKSNIIKVLFEDSRGVLWVGTAGGGLSMYNKETESFVNYTFENEDSSSISNNHVYSIYEDKDNKLWVGTFGGGLNRFDVESGTFTRYNNTPGDSSSICGNIVRAIVQDDDGFLWLGVENGGVDKFDPKTGIVVEHYENIINDTSSLSNNAVLSICKTDEGKLWFGTWAGGINLFDPVNKQFKRYVNNPFVANSLSSNENFAIYEDDKDRLWVSTRFGLDLYDPYSDGFIHFRNNPIDDFSLSHNHVISICQDKNNVMWVGTEGGGINKFSLERKRFKHLDLIIEEENKTYPNDVFSLFEDAQDNIWIGTKGGGLLEFTPSNGKLKRYVYERGSISSLGSNVVRAVSQDENGLMWIGTDGAGLNSFDKKTGQFKHYRHIANENSLANDAVFDVHIDSEGLIWIGTYGGGLDKYDPVTGQFTNYPIDSLNPSQNVILSIFEDSKQRLWVGTNGRSLWLFDRENEKFISYKKFVRKEFSLSNDVILTMNESKTGNLWIGTGGGGFELINFTKKGIESFGNSNTHHVEIVSGILEDKNSNLWISSNKGLFKFNKAENRFFEFTEREGLQGVSFNQDVAIQASDGLFYFGGINGINIFSPDSIHFDDTKPDVVITDFTIFNKSIKPEKIGILTKSISETDSIVLSYNQNIISFEFSALHYYAPEQNKYAYKLEGFEEEWIHVGSDRRFATYTNLPGGDYVFRVKASNYDGVWNEEGTAVVVRVIPPFWETMGFYLSLAISLIILAYGIIKVRERRFKKLQNFLEQRVRQRTVEIEKQKQELLAYNNLLNRQKEELKMKSDSLISSNRQLNVQTKGLEEKRQQVEKANLELKKKNKFIVDSIDYAQKIQESILPTRKQISKHFEDYFIFYRPRDVVSGDFYWFAQSDLDEWGRPRKKLIFACVDCTGHGVPGAFMSMIGNTLLNEIVLRQGVQDPKRILKLLNEEVIAAFAKDDEQFHEDGMDISIVCIDPELQEIVIASAMQKVYFVNEGELKVIEGDFFSIGEMFAAIKKPDFTNHVFSYEDGDAVYMFSDGYQDQFGGEKNEKFREKRLRMLISEHLDKPMEDQMAVLTDTFNAWKGEYSQIDDVLITGLRLSEE